MPIRPLAKADDRSTFSSGDLALDRFFREFAGQNQFRHYLGTTYVYVDDADERRILGFVTVSAGHLDVEDLPLTRRKGLGQYPLPILRLARMAVQQDLQRGGIGSQLVRHVLRLALKMRDELGCAFVVVDAKPGAVPFYERYGFETFTVLEGISPARPEPQPMFLSIQAIAQACR